MKEIDKKPYPIEGQRMVIKREGVTVFDSKDTVIINKANQVSTPKQENSVGERLKLAEKLKSLGVVQMDKRIHKKK